MPPEAENTRTFIVGDIHGQQEKLSGLLSRLHAFDPAARYVFLGDYIDRGGNTREVVDTLLQLRRARPDTVFLAGNHEAAMLHYAATGDHESLRLLRSIGFQATLDSYGAPAGFRGMDFMPEEHAEFFHGLSRWRRVGAYVIFHAPLPYGVDPDAADPLQFESLLCNRAVPAEGWAESGQTLVFGHVPLETPLVLPGLIGIDTGCGRGGPLTALELPELRFHHA